jgi:preprotein translocase subunit SecY
VSILRKLEPLVHRLPEVEKPAGTPELKSRFIWTLVPLLIFFIFGHVRPYGLSSSATGYFDRLQLILASNIGTLATLGIGPIVMSSIILQLLVGAKIIGLNMQDPRDKALFQGVQKLGAMLMAFIQAMIYVTSGYITANPGSEYILVTQLALASIIILYLDEVVTKWGIGSGVGLFIAAGVSQSIIVRMFNPLTEGGRFIGLIPLFVQNLTAGAIDLTLLLPVLFTLAVFFVVVLAESLRIEIPLTFGRVRGIGAKYPLKLLYVSNMPVILAAALFTNVTLWGHFMYQAGFPLLGTYTEQRTGDRVNYLPYDGLAYYLNTPYGYLGSPDDVYLTFNDPEKVALIQINDRGVGFFNVLSATDQDIGTAILVFPRRLFHIFFFALAMVIVCMIFGRFWIETTGLGASDVAEQIQSSGMLIPGFRRDPRITERVLNRYIPTITLIGSAFVGVLAAFADLTGALGTGTGILLTVGIIYRMYEEMAKQQMFDVYPSLRKVFGR